jgi:hypothetical protein
MMEIKFGRGINGRKKLNITKCPWKMKGGRSPLLYVIKVLVPCGHKEAPQFGTQAIVKVAEVIPQLSEVHLLLCTDGLELLAFSTKLLHQRGCPCCSGSLGRLLGTRVFSLDFLGAYRVELLPSSKSSSSSSKVAARVLFLSGVVTLDFPYGETGGGEDGAAGAEWPLNPEAPGVLPYGGGTIEDGGITTGRGRLSRRIYLGLLA